MNAEIKKDEWIHFAKEFNDNNHLKPVKLEVFDDCGIQTEANILPFNGMDIDLKGQNSPTVNLNLGEDTADGRHLFHNVNNVIHIYSKLDEFGDVEALEIENQNNSKTLLTFIHLEELGKD